MTVAAEEKIINEIFDEVETFEGIAETLGADDQRHHDLMAIARNHLRRCPAVRPVIASRLLDLSTPTVRSWITAGILVTVPLPKRANPPRLDPARVHDVLHILKELRAAGQTRGLLDAVWHRLEDQDLLNAGLDASIKQMRAGVGVDIDPHELRASLLRESSLD
ncbi:hypothetical protein [Catellatospora methionotrophica]|uniref:hypothetical protein n=1 Tax=Catellatospora methionotrophica TaxID=121620 RepID=UPI0033FA1AB6